ncbi:helix-turn-helix domain-containing protein [Nocardiopsis sp. LOL_012]|uniref:helix-turn-helix domain-containing protein n=1 Tax=Nocardiopsis sp. LOL_012 TaxID=3345409 RepID=UPI003A844E38
MGRPGPKLEPIDLTDEERDTLHTWTRKWKLPQDIVLRARIVLACDRATSCGTPVSQRQVALELGVSMATVRKWRRRFAEQRLAGLRDAPRPGRPPTAGQPRAGSSPRNTSGPATTADHLQQPPVPVH